MKKQLYVLVALIMAASMILAACGTNPTAAPATSAPATSAPAPATAAPATAAPTVAQPLKVLRYQYAEPQTAPDVAQFSTNIAIYWSGFVNDYLTGWTQDYKVINMLAEKYEPNADYSVWSIKLRDNAKFSDGTPITTDDLAWSIKHYQDNGAQKLVYNLIKSVEIVDAKNAKLHLTEPHSDWLELSSTDAILSHTCEAGCDFYSPKTPTSGPWMLKEYVAKDHMTLVKNPYYWGLQEKDAFPKIDEVDWVFQGDSTAVAAALDAGELDWGYVVPKDAGHLMANPDLHVIVQLGNNGFVGFGMDKTKPPFSDVKVRQAVGMLLEPAQKTTACWEGYALNIYGGYIYQEDTGWSDLFIDTWQKMDRPTRIAAADKLLDEAGWVLPKGQTIRVSKGVAGIPDGTKFSVQVNYEAEWQQAGCHTLLLKDWGADANLDFQPNSYDPSAYWGDVQAGKFQMWHVGLPSSLLPYARFRSLFETGGQFNKYGAWISDPDLDKLIDAANTEQDPAKRKADVKAAQDYLFQQQYLLVDGSQNAVWAYNTAVKGMYINADTMNAERALIFSDIQR
jgi:peptide/nickel transport system substrate-binding protein